MESLSTRPFVGEPYRSRILLETICLSNTCKLPFPAHGIVETNSEGFGPQAAATHLIHPILQPTEFSKLISITNIHPYKFNQIYIFVLKSPIFSKVSEMVASWMSMQLIRKASTGVNATTLAPYLQLRIIREATIRRYGPLLNGINFIFVVFWG